MSHQQPKRRPTLSDVARQVGVDISTVSRVLNPMPSSPGGAASPARAEMIRQVAADLGYQRNPHGASLRTARSELVGVLVPRLSDYVLATIYEGIEDGASIEGLTTFVMNTRDKVETQRARARLALSRRVDGLIMGDAHRDGRLVDEIAEQHQVPIVLVSRSTGRHLSVTCDDYRGGQLVAEHFLELGHAQVGVAAGPAYASTSTSRTAGFVDRYRDAGLGVTVIPSSFDVEGGHEATCSLLQAYPDTTAVFAVNDFCAIGTLGAIRASGRRPGVDVAVAGFNDIPIAGELPLPLTSVRSPMHYMGRRALELLVAVQGGSRPDSEVLTPELVVRASTQAAHSA